MTSNGKYILGACAVALVGYGIYFDHQRRNNPEFRKRLGWCLVVLTVAQQKREAAKIRESHASKKAAAASAGSFQLADEPVPLTNEGREAYFMNNLQLGEQLMQKGPTAFDAAATCFYRALKVYPEPQKLLEVLSQSLPEVILNLIVQKLASDVRAAQTGATTLEEVE
ncbi:hypothetical protein HDU91_000232 [Kappamyces sp. JEL0680]|nr:hypothetical protein HDU91_000232 [Kappamyces sp. JEL0680]